MRNSRQLRRIQLLLVIVVAMSMLLLLLTHHASERHDLALACIVLVPLFLFGQIDECSATRVPPRSEETACCSPAARDLLFQRPPPSVLA
jgi:hypothetical protein